MLRDIGHRRADGAAERKRRRRLVDGRVGRHARHPLDGADAPGSEGLLRIRPEVVHPVGPVDLPLVDRVHQPTQFVGALHGGMIQVLEHLGVGRTAGFQPVDEMPRRFGSRRGAMTAARGRQPSP